VYGLDLLDFFRGRHSWRKLRVLLERLPAASAYVEAVANDEEYARATAAQPDEPQQSAPLPRLSEWRTEVDLLARIVDRLGDVVAAVIAANGGKPPAIRPEPRPVTAVDRARRDARYRKHLDLVAEVRRAQARYAAAQQGG
jgi:hypothetical protein